MATYKVIQDIEAEDKLLGPLSLRQFIYAIIVLALGGIAYLSTKINVLLATPFVPPMIFFGMLAAPFGRDQSSEVWLLAKIRFMFKPRRRIWDQSGLKELVTITVPKKVEKHLTDGLNQTQVKSRLTALASTLDSRGWAIKNVTSNTYAAPSFALVGAGDSDRLIATSALPQQVAPDDIHASDDMLDEYNNPTAAKLETMIAQSAQARRQNLIATMQAKPQVTSIGGQTTAAASGSPTTQQTPWMAQQTVPQAPVTVAATQPLTEAEKQAEQQLLDKIHRDKAAGLELQNGHMKRLQTSEEIAAEAAAAEQAKKAELARAEEVSRLAVNDDLNIETIARQAQKAGNEPQILGDGEVVISLH